MTLTVNTNLSSLIAQRSLNTSTNALNKSIERMTTGFKINSSSDDAAAYSIVNDMTTKISSWDVADSNTNMGIDLLNTASDTIAQMQSNAERLQALCIQARNGTYGDTSIEAIQAEANARVSEIARIYTSAEYNGINLFDKITPILKQKGLDTVAQNAGLTTDITASKGPNGKFIDDVVEETPDIVVSNPNELASAISGNSKIGISNAETLAKLAELVNSGTSCENKTIILTEDIDLSAYGSSYNDGKGWTPIGTDSNRFKGTFNGNGHVVSNLYINNPTADYQGLFGIAKGELKNVGIENCNVTGKNCVGGLVGWAFGNTTNCYATGNVTGDSDIGGLAGYTYCEITNCYATGNVTGNDYVGGLAGRADGNTTNCYATGNVSGTSRYAGGLAGLASAITNSYATGNVSGDSDIGGLVGKTYGDITNSVSFATHVSGTTNVGSFVGSFYSNSSIVTDCNCVDIEGIEKTGNGTEEQNKGISYINLDTNIQVGIYGDDDSRIKFDTSFSYNLSAVLSDISSDNALNAIQTFMDTLSTKSTELGAVTNRLTSALDSIQVASDNLVSSRSTLRDTDVAKESSEYIKQQILQQASATLLATANQAPSIVLSLI